MNDGSPDVEEPKMTTLSLDGGLPCLLCSILLARPPSLLGIIFHCQAILGSYWVSSNKHEFPVPSCPASDPSQDQHASISFALKNPDKWHAATVGCQQLSASIISSCHSSPSFSPSSWMSLKFQPWLSGVPWPVHIRVYNGALACMIGLDLPLSVPGSAPPPSTLRQVHWLVFRSAFSQGGHVWVETRKILPHLLDICTLICIKV